MNVTKPGITFSKAEKYKGLFKKLNHNIPLDSFKIPPSGSRILFVIPHPDDEIAGCGAFISESLKSGCNIKVVFVTNGDGVGVSDYLKYKLFKPKPEFFKNQGYKRQEESIKALMLLGVSEKDIIFLGYPDRFLVRLWEENWDPDKPVISMFTKEDHSIYINSFTPNVPYTGYHLSNDLERIITQFAPTHIVYPHFYDTHIDHFIISHFIKYLIAKLNLNIEEIMYLLHHSFWPNPPGYFPKLPLVPPHALRNKPVKWFTLKLSLKAFMEKKKCISSFKSQNKNILMKFYLLSFLRENELYGTYQEEIKILDRNSIITTKQTLLDVHTPALNTLKCYLNKSADISGLKIEADESNLLIKIETVKKPDFYDRYKFDLIFFNKDQLENRFLFCIENGELKSSICAKNCKELPIGADYQIGDKNIIIKFPCQDLLNIKIILINVNTYKKDQLIDHLGPFLVRIR